MSLENETVDFGDLFAPTASPDKAKPKEYKWRRHRLQVPKSDQTHTEFVCRIIPAMKSCKAENEWFVATEEFYGYDTRDRMDKSKTKKRPFSIKGVYDKKKNAAQQKIYQKKNELAALTQKLSSEGKSQDEIRVATQHLQDWLKSHNKDVKYNFNVFTPDGQLYVLMLTGKAKDALVTKRNKLLEDGVDILDPHTGAWMVFTRTGTLEVPSSIVDTVEPLTEMMTLPGGIKAQAIKPAPITAEMAKKIAENCPDLKTDVSQALPLSLVEKIVNGPEDPDFVDSVWAENAKAKADPASDSEEFFKTNFGA